MHAPDVPTLHRRIVGLEEDRIMEMKVCTSCGKEKPVSDFHRFGKEGSRIGKWCEACYTKKIAGKPAVASKQSTSKPS